MTLPVLPRRQWLQLCAGAALAPHLGAFAQSGGKEAERPIVIAQLADMSPSQQDVSRDFLIGSRAAWQDLNARGGLQGRPVQHLALEVQGSGPSLHNALRSVLASPACIALSGCVGDNAASAIAALQEQTQPSQPLAHVAPWLHSQEPATSNDLVFGIFPDYEVQIAHALKTQAAMGVQELGVVYATAALRQQSQARVQQAARVLKLRIQDLPLPGSSPEADRQLSAPSQPMVLFIGGTPELHGFMRRMNLQPGRQCYIVALADVNLQVLSQMGAAKRNVSVIATQAVPLVSAGMPIVRAYRETLARLYDEPPSPQGLAGFIAARYTAQVLQDINGPLTRASALAAFRRRQDMNLGGFTVSFDGRKRSHAYVTQSMLTADGRIVG